MGEKYWIWAIFLYFYDKAFLVVFGKNRHMRPPLANNTATMNVGAGHMVSSRDAITTLPMIPPIRADTIDIATPVALEWEAESY